MKVVFVYPAMSGTRGSWLCFEPLAIAALNALTPPSWERAFFDERIEGIDYDTECDLVGISVETYTAKNAYQIADKFRKKGRKVVMGGAHATLCPKEAAGHADSVIIGQAETVWKYALDDASKSRLKKFYGPLHPGAIENVHYDKKIFQGKKYFPASLIETGRGCVFGCEFCSVSRIYKRKHYRRPIPAVIEDIRNSKHGLIFFVDDNITADIESAKSLFKQLIPLKIRWIGQASATIALDHELVGLIKQSGCECLLIGFETHDPDNLRLMSKKHNIGLADKTLTELHEAGIKVFASFIIGYDHDTEESVSSTVDHAIRNKMFLANFNCLTPYPGTALYSRLKKQGRLDCEDWWLSDSHTYGSIVFKHPTLSKEKLEDIAIRARKDFYSICSIVSRSTGKANPYGIKSILRKIMFNYFVRKETLRKLRRTLVENSV